MDLEKKSFYNQTQHNHLHKLTHITCGIHIHYTPSMCVGAHMWRERVCVSMCVVLELLSGYWVPDDIQLWQLQVSSLFLIQSRALILGFFSF